MINRDENRLLAKASVGVQHVGFRRMCLSKFRRFVILSVSPEAVTRPMTEWTRMLCWFESQEAINVTLNTCKPKLNLTVSNLVMRCADYTTILTYSPAVIQHMMYNRTITELVVDAPRHLGTG